MRQKAKSLRIWSNGHMQRTIRLKLHPTPQQAETLAQTVEQFTAAFNAVCAYGFTHAEKNGVTLHHATYHSVKAQYPALVSDLVIQARVRATEAVKSALTRQKQGWKVTCPRSQSCPPRYNVHTYTLSWGHGTVRLSSVGGRMTVPFSVPSWGSKYAGCPVDTADLLERHGTWWLHVVVTVAAPKVSPTGTLVGVDLGLARPAVTSTNAFLGKKGWKATEGRYFRLRRALQQRGSRSAKRHLRRMRHAQSRFRRDCDHVLSKALAACVAPGDTLVLERLTNIRTRARARKRTAAKRRLHSWSFAQLKTFLTYKAEERGCTVVAVDPRHTSQTCSRCGHQSRTNRRSRSRFQCRACGFSLHADLNAARNIAAKYLARQGMFSPGALPGNQRIVPSASAERDKPPA
jgi:IS605 OrfB family transposase